MQPSGVLPGPLKEQDDRVTRDRVFVGGLLAIMTFLFTCLLCGMAVGGIHTNYTQGECTVRHHDGECSITKFTPVSQRDFEARRQPHAFPYIIPCSTAIPAKTFRGTTYACYYTSTEVAFTPPADNILAWVVAIVTAIILILTVYSILFVSVVLSPSSC